MAVAVGLQPSRGLAIGSGSSVYFGNAAAVCGTAARRVSWPRLERLQVCMMSKRTVQLAEIREMNDDQINEAVMDLKGEMFLMRCKKASRQNYIKSDYTAARKKVARMLTVKREREIEKGITPRESRKMKKKYLRTVPLRPPPSLIPYLDARDAAMAEEEKKRQAAQEAKRQEAAQEAKSA